MKKYILSYCPTMRPYVEKLMKKIDNIEYIPSQSAAGVLSMLRSKKIDMIIIGRKAYKHELTDNISEKRLLNGYTLAYSSKSFIRQSELFDLKIKTYLAKEIVETKFGFLKNVKFYNTKKECFDSGLDTPILLDWLDFEENYGLLIPIDDMNRKTSIFRAPVLYYLNDLDSSLLENINRIISNS